MVLKVTHKTTLRELVNISGNKELLALADLLDDLAKAGKAELAEFNLSENLRTFFYAEFLRRRREG